MNKGHWVLGSCVAATLAVAACGDETSSDDGGGEAGSETGGSSGSGPTGGASGQATTGGSTGTGGRGGTPSTGGAGDSAGDGGSTGDGGASGEGGASMGGEDTGGTRATTGGSGGMNAGAGGMVAGSGGMRAGAGGAAAGKSGSAGAGGAGGAPAGAGGVGGTPAGAGGAPAGAAGMSGAGGSAGACTTITSLEQWLWGNNNLPGAFSVYGTHVVQDLGPGTDSFHFEFYGTNGSNGSRTGTFELGPSGSDGDFATCSRCFFVVAGQRRLFATSGTLVIGSNSTPMTGVIQLSLTNATFVEVTIDPVTFHAVPVPNGLCTHVDSLEFSRGL